jgi:hypothetical protein
MKKTLNWALQAADKPCPEKWGFVVAMEMANFVANEFKIDVLIDFTQQVICWNEILDHHFQSVLTGSQFFEQGRTSAGYFLPLYKNPSVLPAFLFPVFAL